jgi:spore coat polysaccharide biosynthesis protein SpsF
MTSPDVPAIVQARLSSSRLPGKVLRSLRGRSVIEHVVEAAREFSYPVIVATSTDPSDDPLAEFLQNCSIPCVRGPLLDVYERFSQTFELPAFRAAEWFFRVTGDCPLLSQDLGQKLLAARKHEADIIYFDDHALPRGVAPELVRTRAFLDLRRVNMTEAEREHVTLGIYRRSRERALALPVPPGLAHPEFRLTLDYAEDYALLSQLFDGSPNLTPEAAVTLLLNNPALASLNRHCQTVVPS